jgi:hypothetical protein
MIQPEIIRNVRDPNVLVITPDIKHGASGVGNHTVDMKTLAAIWNRRNKIIPGDIAPEGVSFTNFTIFENYSYL